MSSQVPGFLHFLFVTLVTSHLLNTRCNGSRHYASPGRVVLYRSVATNSYDGNNQHHSWDDRPIRWPDRQQPEPHKYALHNRDDGILFRWNYDVNRPIHPTTTHEEDHHYNTPSLPYKQYEQTNARHPMFQLVNSEHRFGNPQIVHHLHHHHHYYDTSINPLNTNFGRGENLSQPIEPEILYKHIFQLSKSHHENNQQSSNLALQTATVMPRSKEKTNITPEIPPFRPSPQLHQFSEPDPLFHPNKSVFLTHPTPTTTEPSASITSTTEKPKVISIYPDSINAQLPPSESHIDTVIPYISAAAATASKASAASTTQRVTYTSAEESYITDALSTTMHMATETTTAGNDFMEQMVMFQPHMLQEPSILSPESLSQHHSNNSDSSQQVVMPVTSSTIQLNSQLQKIIQQSDETAPLDDTDSPTTVVPSSQSESDTSTNNSNNVTVIQKSDNNDNPKGIESTITILSKVKKESGNNVTILTKVNMQSNAATMEKTQLSRHHLIPLIIQKDESPHNVTVDFNSASHVDTNMGKRKPAETIFIAPQMTYQHGVEIAHEEPETNDDLTTVHPTIPDYQTEDQVHGKAKLYEDIPQEMN
ncbi:uncharacterized protein LOC126281957 [Schistocerca gregaria]|uniref:uncharacterized protein LOC126281957 n=1 Tax=Schistocerca gregaria TaxID=7010 RepID=UPI00211E999B|nr:uncharacterized protein LOC126281957 [Schistocerca gregaria]